MAFESIVKIADSNKRKGSRMSDNKILVSRHKCKNGAFRIAFYLGQWVIEKVGIIKGDKVDVLWDKLTGEGIIRRDNTNGRMVGFSKTGRGTIVIPWHEGMPEAPDTIKEATGLDYKDHEVMFDFPV